MAADDFESVTRERARRAYERARFRRAVVEASPLVAIALMAGAIDGASMPAAIVGPLLFVVAATLLWRGGDLGRGVLPGALAGFAPFVAIHLARRGGHVCTGSICMSMCVPACIVGGVVAGLVVARASRSSRAPVAAWAAGGVVASLVGALGCACVGVGGVVGLVGGLVVGSAPVLAMNARQSPR